MGVGSPQRWPVQPEEQQRVPEKSAPEGQSGAKEEEARGRAASAGLGGPRRLRLCLLTEQMWEQPPLLRLFVWISLAPLSRLKGTPWSHTPSP